MCGLVPSPLACESTVQRAFVTRVVRERGSGRAGGL